ncbi:hypothetical protein [Methylocystis sp.]|nr:hypothetical protein [Methylocystis sp.]
MTYDRAAIMRDTHKRFRDGKRLGVGWTFGQCLRRKIGATLMPDDSRRKV